MTKVCHACGWNVNRPSEEPFILGDGRRVEVEELRSCPKCCAKLVEQLTVSNSEF